VPELPSVAKEWLDGKAFPVVATVDDDGTPQQSVVWAKREGDDILFSTLRNRRKGRNLERDSRIGVLVMDPSDPYRYIEVRGVTEVIDDPGGSLIKELGWKYDDEEFHVPEGQQRVIVRVHAQHVVTYGLD